MIIPKNTSPIVSCNKIIWGERDIEQTNKYSELCNSELRKIDFPVEFTDCAGHVCSDENHREVLNKMYLNIVRILGEAAVYTYRGPAVRKHRPVPGWNKHVSVAHKRARL